MSSCGLARAALHPSCKFAFIPHFFEVCLCNIAAVFSFAVVSSSLTRHLVRPPAAERPKLKVSLSTVVAGPKQDVIVYIEGPASMYGQETVALFTANMTKNTRFFALK